MYMIVIPSPSCTEWLPLLAGDAKALACGSLGLTDLFKERDCGYVRKQSASGQFSRHCQCLPAAQGI